jgi:outer membrane protein assembly factor BamB
VRNVDAGVAAFDVADGRPLWDRDGAFATVDGPDYVVVAEDPGDAPSASEVRVLDRQTGEERWRVDLNSVMLGTVAATSEVVVLGGVEAATAYDAATGERRWKAPISLAGWVARSDEGDVILASDASTANGKVTAIDGATGAELWTAQGLVAPTPPHDGNVYLEQSPAGFIAVDALSGATRWSLEDPTGFPETGPGLIVTGMLELVGGPATIEAVDPANGEVRWSKDNGEVGLPSSSPSYGQTIPSSAGVFSGFVHCTSP